jgi:hypothetical protein
MQRRICIPWVALAALVLAVGMAPSAHAQGVLQAFPQPGGAVFLTWHAVPNPAVVGYNVYRRDVGVADDKAGLLNPQPAASTTLLDAGPDGKGLPLGKPQVYFVRAVYKDAAGKLSEGSSSGQAVVTPQNPIQVPGVPQGSFLYWDIDTLNPGSATLDGNVVTIRASGPDLWDKSDGQTFLGIPVAGDYQFTAQITEQPQNVDPDAGNPWAKIGVEIREGPFKGDRAAFIFASVQRDDEIIYEGRKVFGGSGAGGPPTLFSQPGTSIGDTKFPVWLRLVKQGAKITAFQSFDGNSFTQVGDPQDFGTMPSVTYVGLEVTAARDGQYAIGKFDANSIKLEPK